MKQLVNKVKYYLKIYFFLVKLNVVGVLIYRVNPLIIGLAPFVWLATMLIFLATIFSRVKTLGGWNFWEIVLLSGVHEVIFLLTWATFLTNLRKFIDEVKTGRFDQILLKPISSRFLASFRNLDFTSVGGLLNAFFVFCFSLGKIIGEIHFLKIPGFLIFLLIAYFVCYFVYFIFTSLSLFFINSRTFIDWIFDVTDFDRYPAEIYTPRLRVFLTFFLPILFFAYYPTAYLLGKIGEGYLLIGLFLVIGLGLISHFLWHFGLRYYQSASS